MIASTSFGSSGDYPTSFTSIITSMVRNAFQKGYKKTPWIVDSGATNHMTFDHTYFSTYN